MLPSWSIAAESLLSPTTLQKSLAESLVDPEINIVDFARMEAPAQLLLALKTLNKATEFPRVWNKDDAKQFVDLAKEVNKDAKVHTFSCMFATH